MAVQVQNLLEEHRHGNPHDRFRRDLASFEEQASRHVAQLIK
jgi:hypothetical protein